MTLIKLKPTGFLDPLDILFRNEHYHRKNFTPLSEIRDTTYPYDVYYTDKELIYEFPVLNALPEEISIEIRDGIVTVAKKSTDKGTELEGRTYIVGKIAKRDFDFSFKLGTDKFDTDNIVSELKNGLLTLRVPFKEETQPKRIEIKTV